MEKKEDKVKKYYRECKEKKGGCGNWFWTTHKKGNSCPDCQKKKKLVKIEKISKKRKTNVITNMKRIRLHLL